MSSQNLNSSSATLRCGKLVVGAGDVPIPSGFPGLFGTFTINGDDDTDPSNATVIWYFPPCGINTPQGEHTYSYAPPYALTINQPLFAMYNGDYAADQQAPETWWNGSILAIRTYKLLNGPFKDFLACEVVLSKGVPKGTTIVCSFFATTGLIQKPYEWYDPVVGAPASITPYPQ
jgi:hypothetical protein